MANTLNIQTESAGFKSLPDVESYFWLGDSVSSGSVVLVKPNPTLVPLPGPSLRDLDIEFNPYTTDVVSSLPPYWSWSDPEWPEAVFFSVPPPYIGGQNVKILTDHIWVHHRYGREPIPGSPGYHNLFADFSAQAGIVGDLPGLVVQSDTDLVTALDDLAGEIDEIDGSVLAESLLHPIAVEFGQGKLGEPRPSPEFVALVNQLLTTVESEAKSHDISVDDDGGMSFIIVPVDGTLISGELTTSGNLYAWHYDTDWTTQIDEIEINQDISWLLGWLG